MTASLTDQQLAEIEARCNAATPGPWHLESEDPAKGNIRHEGQGWPISTMWSMRGHNTRLNDASFIAHARTDLPALLGEVRRLRATPPEKREDLYCVISDLSRQSREAEARAKHAEAERDFLAEKLADISDKMNRGCNPETVFCVACGICQVSDFVMEGRTCLGSILEAAREAAGPIQAQPAEQETATSENSALAFTYRVTGRGFSLIRFEDESGHICSLQKSSLVWPQAIRLGIDDANPQILLSKLQPGGRGWVKYPVPEDVSFTTRMHLSQDQVRGLLPLLQAFVNTGELPHPENIPHTAPVEPLLAALIHYCDSELCASGLCPAMGKTCDGSGPCGDKLAEWAEQQEEGAA